MDKYKCHLFLFCLLLLVLTFTYYLIVLLTPSVEEPILLTQTLKCYSKTLYCDLVVLGSEPEGIAAAIASARNGLQVLMIDSRQDPGGLITQGWLNTLDMNYDPQGNLLTRGIFEEFFRQLEGSSFDIETAEQVLWQMLEAEERLTLLQNRNITNIVVDNGRITALLTTDGVRICAPFFVDASQDGYLAALAGATFTIGMEDIGIPRQQAVTLILEIGGVDWQAVVKTLNTTSFDRSSSGAWGNSAWGFLEEMRTYQPQDSMIRCRGLNMGLQNNGNVLINSMLIFDVDVLNRISLDKARQRGQREAVNMVSFIKEKLQGFREAYLVETAPELYVRETRHLQGLYRLNIDDVLEHRDFWDKIALGSYPVDIQATSMNDWGVVVGNPSLYSIPLRCLIPKDLTNLLVVGRAASYDSLAYGSARVVPVGMATGEAAGTAVTICLENKLDLHQLSNDGEYVAMLQERLKKQGAYLPDFEIGHPLLEHPLYPVVKKLRRWGLVRGSYNNDYRLEEPVEIRELSSIIEDYLNRALSGRYRLTCISRQVRQAVWDDLVELLRGIEGPSKDDSKLNQILQKEAYEKNTPLLRGKALNLLLEYLESLE